MRAMTVMLAAGGIALAAWPGTTASQLAAAAFHERFAGQWQGTGTVQRSVDPAPRRVSCGVAGQATEQQIASGGTCRAAVIVTREIAANVTYDPATGRYVGTYIGSQAGSGAAGRQPPGRHDQSQGHLCPAGRNRRQRQDDHPPCRR
jgi:hypothetical protein